MQQGLITPESGFSVPGQIQVADRTIHDDTEHGVESLTTSQILARSSNVGAIEIGKLEGASRFNAWVHRFGFGAPTGVGLPGEEAGHDAGARPLLGLLDGQPADRPGRARDADADGGRVLGDRQRRRAALPAPRQLDRRQDAAAARRAGASSRRRPPQQVRQMLEGVLGPEGTASEISIPGYALAGKTGTASKVDPETGEYSKTKYVASFIGFAPASDPRLLTAVVVDEPQNGSIFGGTVAAPAFGQIMSFALPYLGIQPH